MIYNFNFNEIVSPLSLCNMIEWNKQFIINIISMCNILEFKQVITYIIYSIVLSLPILLISLICLSDKFIPVRPTIPFPYEIKAYLDPFIGHPGEASKGISPKHPYFGPELPPNFKFKK